MRIVITGGCGFLGRRVAIRLLEDVGYFCVDNLPPKFLLEVCAHLADTDHKDVAVAIDSRSEASLVDVPNMVSTLRSFGNDVRVLFLTASDAALIQRFSETRRRHPVSDCRRPRAQHQDQLHRAQQQQPDAAAERRGSSRPGRAGG